LRTLKSVLKHWQAAQKTERKSESESEIAMCDRMQMYNITLFTFCTDRIMALVGAVVVSHAHTEEAFLHVK
jgi:hypothetical protein